jgi:hypothetical protein
MLTNYEMAKYRLLNRQIRRGLPVCEAHIEWVWSHRFRYLATAFGSRSRA